MKTITLIFAASLTLLGCGARLILDMAGQEAHARGLTSLGDSTRFPENVQEARDSLIADMHRRGEEPSEYFTSSELQGDSIVVFHLWHRSALAPSMRGATGKPGGRNFDAYFDRRQQRMTKRLAWQ